MKASEDHLPYSIMSTTLVPDKYIASAAPHLMLCVPYSCSFIFEFYLCLSVAARLIQVEISAYLIVLFRKSLIAKFDFVLYAFDRNEITHYHAFTG